MQLVKQSVLYSRTNFGDGQGDKINELNIKENKTSKTDPPFFIINKFGGNESFLSKLCFWKKIIIRLTSVNGYRIS